MLPLIMSGLRREAGRRNGRGTHVAAAAMVKRSCTGYLIGRRADGRRSGIARGALNGRISARRAEMIYSKSST